MTDPVRRTRVLMVDHSAHPGGGQLGMLRYLRGTNDTDVELVFLTGGPLIDDFRATGRKVSVLDDTRDFALPQTFALARRLDGFLKNQNDFDVIVANSLYAGFALATVRTFRRSLPTLAYYSRVSMDSLRNHKRAVAMTGAFPRFDAFIANSEWTASCIPQRLGGPRHVAYPVCGINEAERSIARKDPCSQPAIRIATFSRPEPWKGLDLLIEATTDFGTRFADREITLDLYGGGFFSDPDYLASLDTLAESSSIPVRRRGHIDNVLEELRSVDILVIPTRQPEPFGQVAAQGLSQGCVVIASDEGGLLEIIQHDETGLLFKSRDVADLRKNLVDIINDPAKAARLSASARQSAARFDDTATIGMLTRAIDEIAAGR